MRTAEINKRLVYYANPVSDSDITDDDGNYTGEKEIIYGDVTAIRLCVSASKGNVYRQVFGENEDYSRTISITEEPITVTKDTIFWIDTLDASKENDYIVTAISDSINSTMVAVKKVDVANAPANNDTIP